MERSNLSLSLASLDVNALLYLLLNLLIPGSLSELTIDAYLVCPPLCLINVELYVFQSRPVAFVVVV